MAETRIQGAVSVNGKIQFKQANTLVETSGMFDYCPYVCTYASDPET